MDSGEFIAKAYDANAFTTVQTSAGYINPEIWNKEVLVYVQDNLVVAPLGKNYSDLLDKPGDTLNITIGVTPTVGADVAESADVAVVAYAKTQIVFTPSERGSAYELTNKEKSRAFIPLMQDMVAQLGYSLALKKDDLCISICTSGTGNAVIANGVDSTAIASSDTIDYDDIVNARTLIREDKLMPYAIVVGVEQYGSLLKLSEFRDASKFNSNVAKTGFIGRIAGLEVYETTQIVGESNSIKALMFAKDGAGVPAFGIAQKKNPYIETRYLPLGRYTEIVAVEDYDVKVLRANGICTIESYSTT